MTTALPSADSVLALAPDEASVKAARGLLSPSKWSSLGQDESAVWGACQGSGQKPYQAQVDLVGPAFQCSCPSRKFPCKHGLALLLLRVQDASRFAGGPQPAWVAEWIQGRREKSAKKEQKEQARAEAAASAAPVDVETARAEAQARDAKRWARIEAGAADLERWLGDVIQRGLAALGGDDRDAWIAFAARMVDAQAPGLANRLESAALLVGIGTDWPAKVLGRLGVLQLTCDAIRNRAALPSATIADLRAALGWPIDKDDVVRDGEIVEDAWTIVGLVSTESDRGLHERRVWLWGRRTGRRALVLEFVYGDANFTTSWIVGRAFEGSLAFYPSASPLRAIVLRRDDAAVPELGWPVAEPLAELRALSSRLAENPWHTTAPLLVSDARIVQGASESWAARSPAHRWDLEIGEADASLLLATSGGAPVTIWGEWTGSRLRPITAWGGEELWQMKGEVDG
jgi:hypothetical protein